MTSVTWHGHPLRMPSLGHRLFMFHFLLHNIPLCQAGTWDVTMCIITITSCLSVRDAGFFRTTGFLFIWAFLFCLAESAKNLSINFICLFKEPDLNIIDLFYFLLLLLLVLTPICAALVLPSISAHCVLVQHHKRRYSYLPSRESRKSTPQCQWQSLPPCSENDNAQPATPFQYYLVNRLLLPSLPLEPTPRRLQPPGTTCYMAATGFLHPVAPQAPQPAGYPAE